MPSPLTTPVGVPAALAVCPWALLLAAAATYRSALFTA
jgi:hypothetical protein